jgi:3-oxoacyl-[acyl-carrier protein] reductase
LIDTGLSGAVVLVTGGASGIGAAVARAFAKQGAKVAVHYLDSADAAPEGAEWEHSIPARTEAEQLASSLPNAVAIDVDLSEEGSETVLLDAVAASLGEVHVLINNAAHCESPDTYQELSTASLTRHYRVNAIAPAMLISELARRRAGNEARVVNISTDAARAFPGQVGYGSSKAALEALTRAAAIDLGAQGIRVNAVAPGPVQTGWMSESLIREVATAIPLGRVGTPEDIADACVFLASHQARWITGQVLQVAGGHAL